MNDKKLHIEEHFNVPEGYFESLTSRIMANIPETDAAPENTQSLSMTVSSKKSWRQYYAASIAASLLLIVGVVTSLKNSHEDTYMAEAELETPSEQYAYTVDEAASYAMFDNQDIYEMLSE